MQSSDRVLARRYARALFLSAAERKEEAKAREELAAAYRALVGQLEFLKSPRASPAAKKAAVKKTLGAASCARVDHFLELLIDKKRVNLLPHVVSDLGRILDEHHGRVRAQVRTAQELTPEEARRLAEKLSAFSGKDVSVETKVDPELLGGIVVRMGDTVLDSSLHGKLRRMAAALAETA